MKHSTAASHTAAALAALAVATTTDATAQSLKGFSPADICFTINGKTSIDSRKILNAALAGVPEKEIDKNGDGNWTRDERIDAAVAKGNVSNFLESFDRRQFEIKGPRGSDGYIDARQFLTQPNLFSTNCAPLAAESPAPLQEARERLDKAAQEVGKLIQVRKDVDNLNRPIEAAQPASLNYFKDWLKDNARTSYEITVGQTFKLPFDQNLLGVTNSVIQVPASFTPYFRAFAQRNSNSKQPDVQNLGAGARFDLFGIPIGNVLDNSFRFVGDYLTDSIAVTSIATGEFIWEPVIRSGPPIVDALGGRFYMFGSDGPFLHIELTGRYRFGHVFDPGPNAAIPLKGEFQRIGGKARGEIGFGGTDILSGISLYGEYWRLATVSGFGGDIYKAIAGIDYKITTNFGFKTTLTRGQNEDTLAPIRQIDAGFTFKF